MVVVFWIPSVGLSLSFVEVDQSQLVAYSM
jgi:hypothetical protein